MLWIVSDYEEFILIYVWLPYLGSHHVYWESWLSEKKPNL